MADIARDHVPSPGCGPADGIRRSAKTDTVSSVSDGRCTRCIEADDVAQHCVTACQRQTILIVSADHIPCTCRCTTDRNARVSATIRNTMLRIP